MAVEDYASSQWEVGIFEQMTAGWGTAGADAAAATRLLIDEPSVTMDTKVVEFPQLLGSRRPQVTENVQHTKGSCPTIAISGIVRSNEVDLFLGMFFHNYSYTPGGLEQKIFTQANGQPCDFTLDGGIFCTLWLKHPDSSGSLSLRLIDCICTALKFSLEPDNVLRYEATLMGRGVPTFTNDTDSTNWTTSPIDIYHHSALQAFQFDSTDRYLESFELTMEHTAKKLGHSSTGVIQTYSLVNWTYGYSMTFVDNGGMKPAIDAKVAAGTAMTHYVRWGNATPGTTDDDLEFHIRGQCEAADYVDLDGTKGIQCTGRIGSSAITDSPVEVDITNSVARASW